MRKLLHEVEIDKRKLKAYGFAFFPTVVIEVHPTHKRWYLIWLEAYEKEFGKKWIIINPLPSVGW